MSVFWVLRNTPNVFVFGQHVFIISCYVVYVNYFISLLSTVLRRFMSVLICLACLDKIVSNRVNDSCISLMNMFSCVLFADIFGVFWRLGRILFQIFLRFSVVRKGFRSLVWVYLLLWFWVLFFLSSSSYFLPG
jgi:hypothetical protein